MKTLFYWLPVLDQGWHEDTYGRMDIHSGRDRILPFDDGTDASLVKGKGPVPGGQWSQIQEGDELWLPVHGHKYSTEKVSWDTKDGLVSWSADEFAEGILKRLAFKTEYFLHYHLLACFGANNITVFAKSFGARLADAMQRRGFRGNLTAYRGATGMAARRGYQIGTSRVTAAPLFLTHRGPGVPHSHLATRDAAQSWSLGSARPSPPPVGTAPTRPRR